MIGTIPQASRLIERLSPSSYESIAACALRVAFGQASGVHRGAGTPATLLGNVCHAVLDKFVTTGAFAPGGWDGLLQDWWEAALLTEMRSNPESEGWGNPARWPGYELKRARLENVAHRLSDLLSNLAGPYEALTEQTLVGGGGLILGRLDLVVRGAQTHLIVDYKSGSVLEGQTGEVRPNYRRQLQIYAALEAEYSGTWPASAYLFPLDGPAVEVEVDPATCRGLVEQVIAALHDFNRSVPGQQAAAPSAETCLNCRFASGCGAFWSECDVAWAPKVLAAAGSVEERIDGRLGGTSLRIDREAGTIRDAQVLVRDIDRRLHPVVVRVSAGTMVGVVGIRPEADRGSYALGNIGQLWAREQGGE